MNNYQRRRGEPGEEAKQMARDRYPGDRNALNDRVHVTLTKMNLRNGYASAIHDLAEPLATENAKLRAALEEIDKFSDCPMSRGIAREVLASLTT